MFLFFILLLTLSCTYISGHTDVCPDIKVTENFDFDAFVVGRWYEVKRYNDYEVQKGADCATFDYTIEGGKVICLMQEVVDQKTRVKYRWVVTQSSDDKAKLYFAPVDNEDEITVLYILDTDYNNYAIFYDCYVDEKTNATRELAWIGSRSHDLKPQSEKKLAEYFKTHPYIDESRMFVDHFTPEACLIEIGPIVITVVYVPTGPLTEKTDYITTKIFKRFKKYMSLPVGTKFTGIVSALIRN